MEWAEVRIAEDRYFAAVEKHKQHDLEMAYFIQTVKQDYHSCAADGCASVSTKQLNDFLSIQLSHPPTPVEARGFAVLFEEGHLCLNKYVQWLRSSTVQNVAPAAADHPDTRSKPLWHQRETEIQRAIDGIDEKFGVTTPGWLV